MLFLALSLAASEAEAAPLERFTLGVASSVRAGSPYVLQSPVELTAKAFVVPWLAVEARAGASLFHGYYFLPTGLTWSAGADLRFGGETGPYGAIGAQAFFPPPNQASPKATVGLRGGWRIPVGENFRISPELQVGVFYVGTGVQFEFPIARL